MEMGTLEEKIFSIKAKKKIRTLKESKK